MRLFGVVGFVFGMMVVVSVGVLYGPRQEASGAYWLLDNGHLYTNEFRQMYRMLPDGRNRRQLLSEDAPLTTTQVRWLPKAGHFFYARCNGENLALVQASVSGEVFAETIIDYVMEPFCTMNVAPSPDGERLMVQILHAQDIVILITDLEGQHPVVVTAEHGSTFGSPMWSPDGEWLYFEERGIDGADGKTFRVRADGSRLEEIAAMDVLSPAQWSGDGEHIMYFRDEQFYQMDAGGKNIRQLTAVAWADQRVIPINGAWIVSAYMLETERYSLFKLDSEGNLVALEERFYRVLRDVQGDDAMVVVVLGENREEGLVWIDVAMGEVETIVPISERLVRDHLWSSDEGWVIYQGIDEDIGTIYRQDVDNGRVRVLQRLNPEWEAVRLELTPDERWVMMSYEDQDFAGRRYYRARIGVEDGRFEQLLDGRPLMMSPLIDLAWGFWELVGVGVVLIGISVGGALVFGRWRRR